MRNVSILTLLLASSAFGMDRLNGTCEQPNQPVVTSGVSSTTRVERTYPSCTVSVFVAGTITPATIFSSNTGTPLAYSFTAATNGVWFFYAANGRYDVVLSGGGMAVPITLGDQVFFDIADANVVYGGSNLTTVGSVPYVSAAGILNQDTAFCWDPTNNRLSVGVACGGTSTLNVTGDVQATSGLASGTTVTAVGHISTSAGDFITTNGNFFLNRNSGQGVVTWANSGVSRFALYNTDTSGTDFCLVRYDAGGVAVDNPLCVTRSTGLITLRNQTAVASLSATGSVNFGSATSTYPMQIGTTLPATCLVGQQFYKSDAAAGQNLYACTSVNAWTPQAGGGGGGYSTIMNQGSNLTQRATVNFLGSGVTCADNAGASRTDCNISGGGGGGGGGFPVSDITTLFYNESDTTKQARFNFAAITSGLLRTYQFPNADTFLAGLSVGQTFSGVNTFTQGNTFSGANYFTNTNLFQANQAFQDVSGGAGTGISPIVIQNGTSTRWVIGSDGGHQNLSFVRYSDAGAPVATVLNMSRATGLSTFGGEVSFGGNIVSNGTTGAAILAAARIVVNSMDNLGVGIDSNGTGLSVTPGVGFPAIQMGGSMTFTNSTCCNIGTTATPANSVNANTAIFNPSGAANPGLLLLGTTSAATASFGAIGYFVTDAVVNTTLQVRRTYTGPSTAPALYALSDSVNGYGLWAVGGPTGNSVGGLFLGQKYDIQLHQAGLRGGTGIPSNPCDNSSMYFRTDGGAASRVYLCMGTVWVPVL